MKVFIRFKSLFESHHISSKWSRTVYTYYGVQSVAVIEDNPYTLLRVAPDMLFGTADTLAEHLGITGSDSRRLEAGLEMDFTQFR